MDGKAPLVSVVMSVYNGSEWLEEAIASIIKQTYSNWEFIIVDDGSDEATKQILKKYTTNPKFKIITNDQRLGLTKNLNIAIGKSAGDLIARMDADDISLPERFQKQVEYLTDHKNTAVVSGFIVFIDEIGNQAGRWEADRKNVSWSQIRSTLPWECCIAHPSVMIRADVFKQFRYNETQVHSQDWDLWLQLASSNLVIEKIPGPILYYRIHPKSITATSLKKSAFRKIDETYTNYLRLVSRTGKRNSFNFRVRIAFLFNRLKLFLSGIKKKFVS